MKFTKHTQDRLFKISIESDFLNDDVDGNAPLPTESVKQLILELELVAAELRKLIDPELEVKAN